jgi:hypothetical protein
MKITLIIRPFVADPEQPTVISPRTFDLVDEFAAHLARATESEVVVSEDEELPVDGFIVVFDRDDVPAGDAARRCVLINADRAKLTADAESYGLVAAIESHRYFQWRTRREREAAHGVFGKKAVIATMGAETSLPESEHYALCSLGSERDLVGLLGAYLKAHEASTSAEGSRA